MPPADAVQRNERARYKAEGSTRYGSLYKSIYLVFQPIFFTQPHIPHSPS